MKLTAPAAALAATLGQALSVLPARGAHPAGAVFLLGAAGGTLSVTASDGTERLTASCAADVSEPGTCCVPAHACAAACRDMADVVSLSLSGDGLALGDGRGRADLRLPDLTPDRYPLGDEGLRELCAFSLPGPALAAALRAALPCLPAEGAATGHLGGVVFDLMGDDLGVMGADARRAVISRLKAGGAVVAPPARPDGGAAGPTPGRFVATMAGRCAKTALALARSAPEVALAFTHGRGTLRGPLFAYAFPLTAWAREQPWRDDGSPFAPRGGTVAAFDAKALATAVARAYACQRGADDNDHLPVDVALAASGAALRGRGQAGEASALCPLDDFSGPEVAVKLSGRILVEHLRSMDGPATLTVPGKDKNVALRQESVSVVIAPMYEV